MFLNTLSDYISNRYKDIISDVCVVVPNMRAKLHIKRNLIDSFSKASFLPEILSTEEFITEVAGTIKSMTIIDNTSQLLKLYETHCRLSKDNNDFHDFTLWAYSVLKDFNELDLYMCDIKSVYTYLSEEQAIKDWNPEKNELTDFERNYVKFLNSLYDYYVDFHKSLLDEGYAYSGMAYRFVAENIEDIADIFKWEKIIFCGFNALSKSEYTIFNYLYNKHLADITWDADKYYINNRIEEAGYFLRRNFSFWPDTSKTWTFDELSKEKNIHIITSPGNLQQTQIACNILNDNNFNPDETAVILADENMLLPLLHSIPKEYFPFNVTMNAPFSDTPVINLFKSIIKLHNKQSKVDNSERFYMQSDFQEIIYNPCIILLLDNEPEIKKTFNNLCYFQQIYTSKIEEIKNVPSYLYNIVKPWNNLTSNAISALNILIEELTEFYNTHNYNIENELCASLKAALDNINIFISKYKFLDNFDNFACIADTLLDNVKVTFNSDPMKGLQIQGVLETRLLDYKNIIMLSVNNDIIPKAENFSSFLTYNIYSACKMPSIFEKDAVFAYHFYRLLERSENIYLIYNAAENGLASSEPSRYITQIINELPRYSKNIHISNEIYGDTSLSSTKTTNIKITKNNFIVSLIHNYLTNNNLSISAINSYLNCPLQFYYRYILKVNDNVNDGTINNAMLGTLVHYSLKFLYSDYLNIQLSESIIHDIKGNINTAINLSFKSQNINHDSGKNLLLYKIIEQYIQRQINTDLYNIKNHHNLIIIDIEKEYRTSLNVSDISNDEQIKSVQLKGIIDRIELIDKNIRIMDYKTGSISYLKNENDIDLDKIMLKPAEYDNPKIIQLLYYALIVLENDKYRSLKSGLYAMRYSGSNSDNGSEKTISHNLDLTYLEKFKGFIKNVICEILNVDKPFEQCTNTSKCIYCKYCITNS